MRQAFTRSIKNSIFKKKLKNLKNLEKKSEEKKIWSTFEKKIWKKKFWKFLSKMLLFKDLSFPFLRIWLSSKFKELWTPNYLKLWLYRSNFKVNALFKALKSPYIGTERSEVSSFILEGLKKIFCESELNSTLKVRYDHLDRSNMLSYSF